MRGVSRKKILQLINDRQYTLITLVALLFFLAAVYVSTNVMVEKRYQKAVAMINQQNWEKAILTLDHMPNHKDGEILKRYALARDELEFKSTDELAETGYVTVLKHLYEIPDSYQGYLKTDIALLKDQVLKKREQSIKKHAVQPHFLDYDVTSVEKVQTVRIGDRDLYYERSDLIPNFEVLYH